VNESYLPRLKDVLAECELHGSFMDLDRTAYMLSLCHRAQVIDALHLTEGAPKLGAQLADCLEQSSGPMPRGRALLFVADSIDDDDFHGRACDLVRKHAQSGGRLR